MLASSIRVGDVQLYDNDLPALQAGNWRIELAHDLSSGGTPLGADRLGAVQRFVVSGPQFSLPSAEILLKYPAPGSAGRFGDLLPYVLLKDPKLPWERRMADTGGRQPWLALLVFAEDELIGAMESPVRATATTVKEFVAPDPSGSLLKPPIQRDASVPEEDPCSFIQFPTSLFQSIVPRLQELRFLSHCRQAHTGDKAQLGLSEEGLISAVVANRFPAVPPAGAAHPAKNIVHLVSLEGLEPYLTDSPNWGAHQSVALLSLASWIFYCQPNRSEEFRGLVDGLLRPSVQAEGQARPEQLLLRLPSPEVDAPVPRELYERLQAGFVPLEYRTRSWEATFAWYRGPLVPQRTTPLPTQAPFLTADSAVIYQPAFGLFDLSLAAAWEIGRTAALSDKAFVSSLLAFRRRATRLGDQLQQRSESAYFGGANGLDASNTAQDQLLGRLNRQLLTDIGAPPSKQPDASQKERPQQGEDPRTALERFLQDRDVQVRLAELLSAEISPLSRWLARLLLLYPVPFDYLVADERMLPVESMRFGHLDQNWVGALLDGALSLGLDSSRETLFYTQVRNLLHEAAWREARSHRAQLVGAPTANTAPGDGPVSGLLIRSALVSNWPNLAVRGQDEQGRPVPLLRMDHLSPSVLLVLFDGIPASIELAEPEEGFRFGVSDEGTVPLRNPVATDQLPLGAQLPGGHAFVVRSLLRSAESRAIRLEPASPDGLIQRLKASLESALGHGLDAFGPADLALQMIKSPHAITLRTPGAGPSEG